MAKITYDDKSYLNQNGSVPNVNKINDSDMNEIKQVVNDNYDEFTTSQAVSTGSLTVSKSSGSSAISTASYAKFGNVIAINISVYTSASINNNTNIFVGTCNTFTPAIVGDLVGYTGAQIVLGAFGTDNQITIKNVSGSSIASGTTINLRGTFIVS